MTKTMLRLLNTETLAYMYHKYEEQYNNAYEMYWLTYDSSIFEDESFEELETTLDNIISIMKEERGVVFC